MIDLSTANPGDRFLRRDGEIVTFTEFIDGKRFPCLFGLDTYTTEGFYHRYGTDDYDIIKKLPDEQPEDEDEKVFNKVHEGIALWSKVVTQTADYTALLAAVAAVLKYEYEESVPNYVIVELRKAYERLVK